MRLKDLRIGTQLRIGLGAGGRAAFSATELESRRATSTRPGCWPQWPGWSRSVKRSPPRRRRPARPGKPAVLVVEDNPDNLRAITALLNDRYQVLEAADGRAGVEQARRRQPDLILMDIALPVMDGVQALQEIRKDETLRHIPVIAVTASAMTGDRETILAHGFDGYLSKPIDAERLKETLHEALD
ncbi:MAG: response regulator [Acidobacteria bacterium]|nr:response regulator [Acidobacteriota bacterium]